MKSSNAKSTSESTHAATSFLSGNKKGSFFSSSFNNNNSFFGPSAIQPKLEIGQPNDKYEQEADRVADTVMRMPDPQIQRQPVEEEEEELQMKRENMLIQRKCEECEREEKLQKKTDSTAPSANRVSSNISNQLVSQAGTGSRLPKPVRSEMAHKMGADFGGVNIHAGPAAHKLNRQLGARAFTHGSDIYFNKGEYNPDSSEGKHLLAHELTHVVQQGGAKRKDIIQKQQPKELEEETTEDSPDSFNREALDRIIPVNSGFYFDLSGGVTWGVPVYSGGNIRGEIFRHTEDTLTLIIYKEGRIGFDTGIGAGFFIGGSRKRSSSDNEPIGGGGEAGVNVELGGIGVIIEQYNLPVSDVYTALFRTWLDQGFDYLNIVPGTGPVISTIDNYLESYSERYLVRTKYRFGTYGSATGELTFGFRRASEHAREVPEGEQVPAHTRGSETWTTRETEGSRERKFPSEVPKITSDPLALLNFLRFLFSTRVSGEILMGADLDKRGENDIVRFYLEGQTQLLLELPIPFLSDILQMFPSGMGMGVEFEFEYEGEVIKDVRLKVYQYSGEDEVFRGSTNKETVTLNLTNFLNVDEIFQILKRGRGDTTNLIDFDLKRGLEEVEFWHRFNLASVQGIHFRSLLRRSGGTRSLLRGNLKKRATALGMRVEAYLTLGYKYSAADVFEIFKLISEVASSASEAAGEAEGIVERMQKLLGFFVEFKDPELVEMVEKILETAVVNEAELRLMFGAGGGASGKVAKGAKARFDISVEGGAFCATNLVEEGNANLIDVLNKLGDIYDDPMAHFPNCRQLNKIGQYDEGTEEDVAGQELYDDDQTTSEIDEEQEDSSSVTYLETSETSEDVSPDRTFMVHEINSDTLNKDSQPSESEVHDCQIVFQLDGQIYAVDLELRVISNNEESESIVLAYTRNFDVEGHDFVFGEGMEIQLPYSIF